MKIWRGKKEEANKQEYFNTLFSSPSSYFFFIMIFKARGPFLKAQHSKKANTELCWAPQAADCFSSSTKGANSNQIWSPGSSHNPMEIYIINFFILSIPRAYFLPCSLLDFSGLQLLNKVARKTTPDSAETAAQYLYSIWYLQTFNETMMFPLRC